MNNQPSILVIILNWRQPQTTIECVQAVRVMNGRFRLDILLIDNGSGEGHVSLLRQELPDILLIVLPHNLGFAGGVNVGLRQAIEQQYDYALLLNNDAFPAPDMLTHLLAEATPDIALLSPKILYEVAPHLIWFAGGRQEPRLLEMRDTGQCQPDGSTWVTSRDVDYLVGTGLLVNLTAVQQAGLLDDHFFMYYEDLDWCIRLRQTGYRLRLVASAQLYHRVALSTGGEDSPLHRYHLARSSLLFFRRHAHLGRPWIIFFYRFGSAAKMVGRLIIQGKWKTAVSYLRGLRDGWQISRTMV